ncbi:hypothetical protein [Sporosarcina sp. 6E9]|uniref:hypothetical protein n=1 Tax=Sporosarcina sp. 6E9 TaxID=2819235 RepID=UPI001FF0C64F|nr:hypothetical protein [Sporosarcina sp. 6E9]
MVLKNNKQSIYINMSLGTIGILLIALAAIGHLAKVNDYNGSLMISLGVILTIVYINYLEKKAGINKILIWVRSGVYMVLFFSLSYFLYF